MEDTQGNAAAQTTGLTTKSLQPSPEERLYRFRVQGPAAQPGPTTDNTVSYPETSRKLNVNVSPVRHDEHVRWWRRQLSRRESFYSVCVHQVTMSYTLNTIAYNFFFVSFTPKLKSKKKKKERETCRCVIHSL